MIVWREEERAGFNLSNPERGGVLLVMASVVRFVQGPCSGSGTFARRIVTRL